MARKRNKTQSTTAETAAAAAAAATPAGFDSELDAFFKAATPAPLPTVAAASSRTASSAPAAGPSNPKKRKAVQQGPEPESQPGDQGSDDNENPDEDQDDDDIEMEEGDGDLSSIDEELDDEGSLLFSQSEDDDSDKEDDEQDNEPYVPPQHESLTTVQPSETTKPRKKKFQEVDEPLELRNQRTLFIGNIPIETARSRSLKRKLTLFIESFSPYPVLTKATGLRFRSVAFSVPTVHLDADENDDGASKKNKTKKGKAKERSQNYREAVAAVEGSENTQAPLTAQQKRKIAFINKEFHKKAKSVSAYITIAHPKAVLDHLYDVAPRRTKGRGKAKVIVERRTPRVELDPRLTGRVLAALIASFADGQAFEGRHLRVDLVKSISPAEVLTSGLEKVQTFDGTLAGSSILTMDPKSTVFVGGLDFETDEEEVRAFFEALLVQELGQPGQAITIPITSLDGKPVSKEFLYTLSREFSFVQPDKRKVMESVTRNAQYVGSVRLIRDAATQMGKGIGYVRFTSQQCVDEVMAVYNAEQAFLESRKGLKGSLAASAAIAVGEKEFRRRFKLHGRPIRVAYCKSQTKNSHRTVQHDEPTTPQRTPGYERSSGAPTPNGTSPHALVKRPKLMPTSPTNSTSTRQTNSLIDIEKKAQLYQSLTKDQRKQLKKDDQDRVNRRLAKKNNKLSSSFANKHNPTLFTQAQKLNTKHKLNLNQPSNSVAHGLGTASSKRTQRPFKKSAPKHK